MGRRELSTVELEASGILADFLIRPSKDNYVRRSVN